MNAPASGARSPARQRPVIVLADTSGSMSADGKIGVLDAGIEQMARELAAQQPKGERIELAAIAFGGERAHLAQEPVAAAELAWRPLQAAGGTPLGGALSLLRALLEDPLRIHRDALHATLVLVSDGRPTDDWRAELKTLLACERAAQARRIAIAIGADADRSMLRAFLDGTGERVLDAYEARDIVEHLHGVVATVGDSHGRAGQTLDELVLGLQPDLDATGPDIAYAPAIQAERSLHSDTRAMTETTRVSRGDTGLGTETKGATCGEASGDRSAWPGPTDAAVVSNARTGSEIGAESDDVGAGNNSGTTDDEEDKDELLEDGEVIAEDGRVWSLDRRLDSGGQGTVYTLTGGPLVAKVLHARSATTSSQLRERLTSVQRLPLDGLPIARPLVQLREPRVGYVMRLVDDVMPLYELATPPSGTSTEHWYARAGGVHRRLRLLGRLADVLDRLHAQAIVYGDLSLANVLVSAAPAHHEAWLIDPDNLRYTSAPGESIFTEEFAAPELMAHRVTPTTQTDAYALAVVVERTLTGRRALSGEYTGRRRSSWERSGGFDVGLEFAMSPRLRALAHDALVTGASEPTRRPRAGAWAAELEADADLCLSCPRCEQSYVATGARMCPWCGAPRPRLLLASIGVCDERGALHIGRRSPRVLAREGTTLRLTRRHAYGERDFATQHELAGALRLAGERVLFEPTVAGAALAERSAVRDLAPGERVELPAPAGGEERWAILFAVAGAPHRLARLQVLREERA